MGDVLNASAIHQNGQAKLQVGIRGDGFTLEKNDNVVKLRDLDGEYLDLKGKFELIDYAADSVPRMDGTADFGSSNKYARADHVHPTDISRAPLSHNHSGENITSGTVAAARLGTMSAATSTVAGASGAVPAPAAGAQGKFLRGDATWQTPTNTVACAYCSTAAATAAKVASCSGYVLLNKSWLIVTIAAANTVASAITLNVNSKGAKPIYINGAASSASNYTLPAGTYLVYFDGTAYQFRTDGKIPGITTGNAPTSHASTGTGYGKGTDANYGHLKLSDAVDSTSGVSGGIAATPAAVKAAYDLAKPYSNAGAHNAVYRGKSLGTSVTAAQWAAIAAGTFDDLFIGDYWTINNVTWRIAAFDYWYNSGDTACTTHHAVIVPDSNIGSQKQMNTENTTAAGYYGSAMRGGDNYPSGGNISTAVGLITAAFGSAHILSHREYLTNAASDYATGGSYYDSTVDLMSEIMVYGGQIFTNVLNGAALPNGYVVDKSQLPLFALRHDLISNGTSWWLRDVCSSIHFPLVNDYGAASVQAASNVRGVRPVFAIK